MCPVCATTLATWLLAGTLGSGGAAVVLRCWKSGVNRQTCRRRLPLR